MSARERLAKAWARYCDATTAFDKKVAWGETQNAIEALLAEPDPRPGEPSGEREVVAGEGKTLEKALDEMLEARRALVAVTSNTSS